MVRAEYNKRMYRQCLILLLMLLFSVPGLKSLAQDIKIKITGPETVMVGDRFRVNYVIESDKEVKQTIMFKKIDGFNIIYGPAVSTSLSVKFVEGERVSLHSSTSSYYLVGPKPGKYTLPRAEVTINGKKYKSDTFKIEVKGTDKDIADEKRPGDDIDAFVKTIISKPGVNLSDTLMITYRLYSTHDISRIVNSDFPVISGFYSSNVTRMRQSFKEEVVDGRTYRVVDLRKLILQPRELGMKTIPEGEITLEYAIPTGRKIRDLWGDVYDETRRIEKTLTIDPVTIRVQDLKSI